MPRWQPSRGCQKSPLHLSLPHFLSIQLGKKIQNLPIHIYNQFLWLPEKTLINQCTDVCNLSAKKQLPNAENEQCSKTGKTPRHQLFRQSSFTALQMPAAAVQRQAGAPKWCAAEARSCHAIASCIRCERGVRGSATGCAEPGRRQRPGDRKMARHPPRPPCIACQKE